MTHRRNGLRILTALVTLLLTACMSPSARPSLEPSASYVAPADAALDAIGCQTIGLRGPDGDPIDLTGTWGRDPNLGPLAWDVQQLGDCLILVEFGSFGTPFSERVFHLACDAKLSTDFTAEGRCVQLGRNFQQVGQGAGFTGPMTIEIEFDEAGEPVWWLVDTTCDDISCPSRNEPPYTRTLPGEGPIPSGSPGT